MHRRIWKRSIGNLSRWPPMSWRPQMPSPLSSSSDLDVLPSSTPSGVALNSVWGLYIGKPPGPNWGGSWWIIEFDHLVQTRNEKHSAILHTNRQIGLFMRYRTDLQCQMTICRPWKSCKGWPMIELSPWRAKRLNIQHIYTISTSLVKS